MEHQQHMKLVQLLLRVPGVQNYNTRSAMLHGIPNRNSLLRDEGNPRTDIDQLVSQLTDLYLSSGEWALLIFVDNARSWTTGTMLDDELAVLRQQLVAQAQASGKTTSPSRPVGQAQSLQSTPSDQTNDKAIAIFYCYAPEDERYCKELEKQLAVMRRKKIITSYGLNIQFKGGADTQDVTNKAFEAADIVLLLVSPDFMASDSLYEEQVKPALLQRDKGTKTVIPIIVRDSAEWKDSEFGKLFALPREKQPIVAWGNHDAAFASIAADIRRVVEDLRK